MAALQHSRRGSAHPRTAKAETRVVVHRDRRGRLVRSRIAIAPRRFFERFSAPSFTSNTDTLTQGDVTAGEDPLIRQSLIDALGNYNGTALAIDPKTGRILSMVNQKMALGPGSEPCSTIKLTVALAALSEGLVNADTPVVSGWKLSREPDLRARKERESLF